MLALYPCRLRSYSASESRKALLDEMWACKDKEKDQNRVLWPEEYTPSFLLWGEKYLHTDPALLLHAGLFMGKWYRYSKSAGSKLTSQENCNSQLVALKLSGSYVTAASLEPGSLQKSSTLISVGDEVVYRKPLKRLLVSREAERWRVQIVHELRMLQQTVRPDDNPSEPESHFKLEASKLAATPEKSLLATFRSTVPNGGNLKSHQGSCRGTIFIVMKGRRADIREKESVFEMLTFSYLKRQTSGLFSSKASLWMEAQSTLQGVWRLVAW